MRDPIELLINLYELYSDGKLASEFNKTKNKMVNLPELVAIMEDVHDVIPARKKPQEAAKAMRELQEQERSEAIVASDKVIDLRAEFARKVALNGGVYGLVKQLVTSIENGENEDAASALEDLNKVVRLNENLPEEV
jgi:hypothetical protein